MSSKKPTITQTTIKRYVRAVLDAGVCVARVEVDGGKVAIFGHAAASESPLEKWRAGRNGARKISGN